MRLTRQMVFVMILLLIPVTGFFGIHKFVTITTADHVFQSMEEVPHNKVGLLLGTAKLLSSDHINLYYKHRIDAAVKLFEAGKVDFILASGDNSSKYYDEPTTIKLDLIKRGIPANKIFLDYAGFRTLDSVIRCKEVFGQTSVTIISQRFHNERAIFIANYQNIDAVGFNARDVTLRYGAKTRLRERFARIKMVIDLIIGKQPKFLGEPVEIR